MSATDDLKFLETFVGPCQHLGTQVVLERGWPQFKCMMSVSLRGIVRKCNAGRPLTNEEIKSRRW